MCVHRWVLLLQWQADLCLFLLLGFAICLKIISSYARRGCNPTIPVSVLSPPSRRYCYFFFRVHLVLLRFPLSAVYFIWFPMSPLPNYLYLPALLDPNAVCLVQMIADPTPPLFISLALLDFFFAVLSPCCSTAELIKNSLHPLIAVYLHHHTLAFRTTRILVCTYLLPQSQARHISDANK